jgi:hypothetical protein
MRAIYRVLRESVRFGKPCNGQKGSGVCSSLSRCLYHYRDPERERLRKAGTSSISAPSGYLRGMAKPDAEYLCSVQKRSAQAIATLDLDAIVAERDKRDPL